MYFLVGKSFLKRKMNKKKKKRREKEMGFKKLMVASFGD